MASNKEFRSVWTEPEKPRRRIPNLDRERIVRTAMEILDAEGVDGLRMRSLAKRLGVAPMTLYWYVETKDDLLEILVDEVFGEAIVEPRRDDWRNALEDLAVGLFTAVLRHSWVVGLIGARPPVGPNAARHMDLVIDVCVNAGFDAKRRDAAVSALYYYVLGAALVEGTWVASVRASGHLPAEAGKRLAAVMTTVAAKAGSSPATLEYLRAGAEEDTQRRFIRGLRCLLRGLELGE